MLTGEADMTTLVMSAERLLTQGDAIYAVKTLANAAGLSSVGTKESPFCFAFASL